MSNAGAAQEPSMEDILASIRKIISDDGEQAEPKAAAAEESASDPEPEVPANADADAQSMIDDMFDDASAEMAEEASADDIDAIMAAAEDASADDIDAIMAAADEAPAEEPEEEILDLTAEMVAKPAEMELVEGLDDDIDFSDIEEAVSEVEAPKPEPVAAAPAPVTHQPSTDPLLSSEAETSVSTAFQSLAGMMLSNNARTIDGLVEDMLRPMLKEWLDNNLPTLVEKIVRAEIERVTRGSR